MLRRNQENNTTLEKTDGSPSNSNAKDQDRFEYLAGRQSNSIHERADGANNKTIDLIFGMRRPSPEGPKPNKNSRSNSLTTLETPVYGNTFLGSQAYTSNNNNSQTILPPSFPSVQSNRSHKTKEFEIPKRPDPKKPESKYTTTERHTIAQPVPRQDLIRGVFQQDKPAGRRASEIFKNRYSTTNQR